MSSIAVDVKNLTFSYNGADPLLCAINFSVLSGEVFVIAGASGSGKTTLCRILCGIIPHAVKGNVDGEISIMDINPVCADLPQASLRVGMVFQDSDSQIICTTVEDEIAFGLENLCVPADDILRRVDALLSEFGFQSLRHVNPARLSDGQKKLLTIASVLATSPPILILDEPLSGLDSEGCRLVMDVINMQKDMGRTVIIVEHDLRLVMFANRWLLLHEGEVAACAAPEDIMQNKDMLRAIGVWL